MSDEFFKRTDGCEGALFCFDRVAIEVVIKAGTDVSASRAAGFFEWSEPQG